VNRQRWAAALLVTVLSIGLAEVTCGNEPWALVNPVGWILLVPVYGVQTLLIATIVLRVNPRPTLMALWSVGVVMGLYEFYITHVLWDAPWIEGVNTGPLEVTELLVISMTWHPFMAVILPILLTEQVMVRFPTLASALPPRLRRLGPRASWGALTFLALLGAGHFFNEGRPWAAAVFLPISAAVVWGTVVLARRVGKVDTLADVMPTRAGVVGMAACLAVLFGAFIAVANIGTEDLERVSWERQAVAIELYALFVLLAIRNLRHRSDGSVVRFRWIPVSRRTILWYIGIASVMAFVPFSFFLGPAVLWYGGSFLAPVLFVLAVRGAVTRPSLVEVSASSP